MPNKLTKDQRQQQAQDHPQPFAAAFGEDLGPPVFGDLDRAPAKGASAVHHARQLQLRRQEAAEDRDLRQLGAAAAEDQQERELARAIDLIQHGRRGPRHHPDQCHGRTQGPRRALSSAEQVAAATWRGAEPCPT